MPKFNGIEYPETCAKCQFFRPPIKTRGGYVVSSECHRHAPVTYDSGWPKVDGDDMGCPEGFPLDPERSE